MTKQVNLQDKHEKAHTLIAFHASHDLEGNKRVRSSVTDVLMILFGLLGRSESGGEVILNLESANHRRFLDVS